MKGTRLTDEQIVAVLRDAEVRSVVAAARKHSVSERSLHRWRKKFAGVQVSDVRELPGCARHRAPGFTIGRSASAATGTCPRHCGLSLAAILAGVNGQN